jgi:hypothetical protein
LAFNVATRVVHLNRSTGAHAMNIYAAALAYGPRLLADGHSNHQIADELFLSLRTVTTHVNGTLGKLDLPSCTATAAFAMRSCIA